MKVYIVLDNNHEEYAEDYREWVDGVYATKSLAQNQAQKLKQKYFKDFAKDYGDDFDDAHECRINASINYKRSPVKIQEYNLQTEENKNSLTYPIKDSTMII